MSIALKYVPVTVDDVEAGIRFYRDGLGFETVRDVASNGFRWVQLGAPGGGPTLVLSEPSAGRSEDDADALATLLLKGSLPFLVFEADDLGAAFDRARAAGGEVLQEPQDQPWGPADCALRDPAGNTVRIAQR